jgi:DNA polymerase III alpha subunit
MAARLTVECMDREFDKLDKYEHDCTHNLGFTIMNPDLNKAKMHYRIIDDHTLMRPMLIKGIGTKAAEDIVAHQPYKGSDLLLAFATKVGKAVNSKVMEAMYDAGLWKSTGKSKPQILKDFETIKEDRRKGKGRPNTDLFA